MIKRCILFLCFLLFILNIQHGAAQVTSFRKVHFGLYAGLGLPRVPFSLFHPPISILGGGMANIQVMRRFFLQIDGLGLYTINLGTLTGEKKELRYNLYGGSFNFLYAISRSIASETFITVGMDNFNLSQKFDTDEEKLTTWGINLGLAYWRHYTRWSSIVELRWHFLFDPNPNPQMLLITFGVLL